VIATHPFLEEIIFDYFTFEIVTLQFLQAAGRAPIVINFEGKPRIAHFRKQFSNKQEFLIEFLRDITLLEEKKIRKL